MVCKVKDNNTYIGKIPTSTHRKDGIRFSYLPQLVCHVQMGLFLHFNCGYWVKLEFPYTRSPGTNNHFEEPQEQYSLKLLFWNCK